MLIKLQLSTIEQKKKDLVSFDSDEISYNLIKFRKTNQGTNINLKPIVKRGDRVKKVKFFVKVMQHKKEN